MRGSEGKGGEVWDVRLDGSIAFSSRVVGVSKKKVICFVLRYLPGPL